MSDAGLRIRDESGNVIFDGNSTVARILGAQTLAANSSGSVTNAEFAQGEPFAILYPITLPDQNHYNFPKLTFSGNKLTWTAGTISAHIAYGVYPNAVAGVPANDAGFRFRNASGSTIIDGVNSNLFYVSKSNINLAPFGTTTLTVTATHPVVAYRGTSLVGVLQTVDNENGTWSITIVAHLNVGAAGTIYIFDTVANAAKLYAGSAGCRFRDASGNVLFDSRYGVANIMGAGEWPMVAPGFPEISTLAHDSLALVLNSAVFVVFTSTFSSVSSGHLVETDVNHVYLCGGGVNGTTLTVGSVDLIFETNLGLWDDIRGYDRYFLVDVSKF